MYPKLEYTDSAIERQNFENNVFGNGFKHPRKIPNKKSNLDGHLGDDSLDTR